MGLGLSVCRSIITAHHGKLWATNNADGGATFNFTVPVHVPEREVTIADRRSLIADR
jgi:K+-sensing histidine kinase KdpD